MKEPKPQDNPWRAMGLVGAMGAELGVCIGIGYWLGNLVDKQVGKDLFWALIGMGLGFAAGIAGVIYLIRFFVEDNKRDG